MAISDLVHSTFYIILSHKLIRSTIISSSFPFINFTFILVIPRFYSFYAKYLETTSIYILSIPDSSYIINILICFIYRIVSLFNYLSIVSLFHTFYIPFLSFFTSFSHHPSSISIRPHYQAAPIIICSRILFVPSFLPSPYFLFLPLP